MGSESSLLECQSNEIKEHNCEHSEDAGVRCEGKKHELLFKKVGKILIAYGLFFFQPHALVGQLGFWSEQVMYTIKEEVYLHMTMTSISTKMVTLIYCVDELKYA